MSSYPSPYPIDSLRAQAAEDALTRAREVAEAVNARSQRIARASAARVREGMAGVKRMLPMPNEWRPGPVRSVPLFELDADHRQEYLERIARTDQTPDHQAFVALVGLPHYSDGLNTMADRGRELRGAALDLMFDEYNRNPEDPQDGPHGHPDHDLPWIQFEGDPEPFATVYRYLTAATWLMQLELVPDAKTFCDALISQVMDRDRDRKYAPLGFLYVPRAREHRRTQLLIYPVGNDREMIRRAAWEWACLLAYYRLRGLMESGPGYPGDVKWLPRAEGDVNETPFLHAYAHRLWWGGLACDDPLRCECVEVDRLRNARPTYHPFATGTLHKNIPGIRPQPPAARTTAGPLPSGPHPIPSPARPVASDFLRDQPNVPARDAPVSGPRSGAPDEVSATGRMLHGLTSEARKLRTVADATRRGTTPPPGEFSVAGLVDEQTRLILDRQGPWQDDPQLTPPLNVAQFPQRKTGG